MFGFRNHDALPRPANHARLFYATLDVCQCVAYPLSSVPENFRWLFALNPMVFIIEAFRFAFMEQGTVYLWQICASMVVSIVVIFFGLALFNKMERTCVDMI